MRGQFIPLRKAELVETLRATPGLRVGDSEAMGRFCLLVEGLVHRDYQFALEKLKNAYAPFDPDADTHKAETFSPAELGQRQESLFREFGWLLSAGNFLRLAQDDIDRALAARSQWGLNLAVDFRIFERLEVYCRGDVTGQRYLRGLRNWFRPETVEVPIYQRLIVIFRLRPDCRITKYLDTPATSTSKSSRTFRRSIWRCCCPALQVKMSKPRSGPEIVLPTLSGVAIVSLWKSV